MNKPAIKFAEVTPYRRPKSQWHAEIAAIARLSPYECHFVAVVGKYTQTRTANGIRALCRLRGLWISTHPTADGLYIRRREA